MHIYCIMNFHVICKLDLVHHPLPEWKWTFHLWEVIQSGELPLLNTNYLLPFHCQVHPSHCMLDGTWWGQDWLNPCFRILPMVCKKFMCSSCKAQNVPKISWAGGGTLYRCAPVSEQFVSTGKSFPNTTFPLGGRSQFSSQEIWIIFYSIRQMVSYLQIPIF